MSMLFALNAHNIPHDWLPSGSPAFHLFPQIEAMDHYFRQVPVWANFPPHYLPHLYQQQQRESGWKVISTVPFGSSIASAPLLSSTDLQNIPQSSADFRPAVSVPVTLADLLPLVDSASRRRHNKSFKLILEWLDRPADQILLCELFGRLTMTGFRPFLRDKGYLENMIMAYRKGLRCLRNLAASHGVQVEPEYKSAWIPLMKLAKENYCMLFAEHFEARYGSPADVPIEAIKDLADQLIKDNRERMAGARKAKANFLRIMRQSGFIEQQPVAVAREKDYGVPVHELPQPLRSEVEDLRSWSLKDESCAEWDKDWDHFEIATAERYLRLREVTANQVVAEIGRLYGYVKNVREKDEGIDSLASLLRQGIVRSYQLWLQNKRMLGGTSMRTRLGTMFSTLKYCPGASNINLTWAPALLASIPKTPRNAIEAKKRERIVAFSALEEIPDFLRKERNALITVHKRAEKAEQAPRRRERAPSTVEKLAKARTTRLVRIAMLAQQELIIRYLLVLAWRNENLTECRTSAVGDLTPNLFQERVVPYPGVDLDEWVRDLVRKEPDSPVWQFSFSEEETKAGRPVEAILPAALIAITEEYLTYFRPLLICGEDPGTLLINQAGNAMSKQQLEEAVEEVTIRFTGRSVNPHLFRDLFAFAFLSDPDNKGDFTILSKALWHATPEVTIREYAWMYNESVGTNAAGKWAEKRERSRLTAKSGTRRSGQKYSVTTVPVPPALNFYHPVAASRRR